MPDAYVNHLEDVPKMMKRRAKNIENVDVPKKDDWDEIEDIVNDDAILAKRKRNSLKRSEIFTVFQPLCVLQKQREPTELLNQVCELLKANTEVTKQSIKDYRDLKDHETVDAIITRGVIASKNKIVFRKIVKWTMKNCRPDMVKKVEEKLGYKLKKKTKTLFEQEAAPELPEITTKILLEPKKRVYEEIDPSLFPNLMVNRYLNPQPATPPVLPVLKPVILQPATDNQHLQEPCQTSSLKPSPSHEDFTTDTTPNKADV